MNRSFDSFYFVKLLLLNKENIPKLSTLIRISLAAGIEPQQLFSLKFDFENYMSENNILKVSRKKKKYV